MLHGHSYAQFGNVRKTVFRVLQNGFSTLILIFGILRLNNQVCYIYLVPCNLVVNSKLAFFLG